MGIDANLLKVKENVYVSIIWCASLTSSGFLFLCVYFHDFFIETDDFRLTVLSISITLPLAIVNCFIMRYVTDDLGFEIDLGFGAIIAQASLLISLLLGYFFGMPIAYAAVSIICLELAFLSFGFYAARNIAKRKIEGKGIGVTTTTTVSP